MLDETRNVNLEEKMKRKTHNTKRDTKISFNTKYIF